MLQARVERRCVDSAPRPTPRHRQLIIMSRYCEVVARGRQGRGAERAAQGAGECVRQGHHPRYRTPLARPLHRCVRSRRCDVPAGRPLLRRAGWRGALADVG